MGFGVWGLSCDDWYVRFDVWVFRCGSRFEIEIRDLIFEIIFENCNFRIDIWPLRMDIWDLKIKIWGVIFKISDLWFKVWDSSFDMWDLMTICLSIWIYEDYIYVMIYNMTE